jgi:hypothetical protein
MWRQFVEGPPSLAVFEQGKREAAQHSIRRLRVIGVHMRIGGGGGCSSGTSFDRLDVRVSASKDGRMDSMPIGVFVRRLRFTLIKARWVVSVHVLLQPMPNFSSSLPVYRSLLGG